ncbi:MAG: hypothetical protein ABI772_08450, partial [Bacteroidota bacterium]
RTIEGVLAAGYTFKKIAVKLGYNIKLMERSVLKKTFLDESTDQREVSYSSSYNEKYFRPTLGIEYNFKRPGSRVYFIPEFTVQRLAKKYYTFLFNLNVMLKTYRR